MIKYKVIFFIFKNNGKRMSFLKGMLFTEGYFFHIANGAPQLFKMRTFNFNYKRN